MTIALNYLKQPLICVVVFTLVYMINPLQVWYNEDRLFCAYMLTCIYGGWTFINYFMPRQFILVVNLKIWMIYFVIKAIISGVVGFFVTPFMVIYNLVRAIRTMIKN